MRINADFAVTGGMRGRGARVYPETPAREEIAALLTALGEAPRRSKITSDPAAYADHSDPDSMPSADDIADMHAWSGQ